VGYAGTKGTGLFQSIDGNQTVRGTGGTVRIDPGKGIIRERRNCTSSSYHSLQTRPGEIAFPHDPANGRADRGRSTYDRPQRFTINGVFELPFMRRQKGALGRILGGWQLSGFLTLQSGAPFTVLNGSDPGGIVTGNLAGTSIRPFLNTYLDLSKMRVRQVGLAVNFGFVFRTRAEAAYFAG
jgi:hypothetical protein